MVRWKLADRFRSHWVKVKFYKEEPKDKLAKRVSGMRFCEAVVRAVITPIILDKEDIACPGANYVFGSKGSDRMEIIRNWQEKRKVSQHIAESILAKIPVLKGPFRYIGLNTDGEPDLAISYLPPEEVMHILKVYHEKRGKNLDVSLSSVMSICGSVAVKTFETGEINISFGCEDSRKYADIGRNRLAIGIPSQLFEIFI